MIPALLVDAVAVHRLTRLLTRDKIAEPIREAWIGEAYERADKDPPKVTGWGSRPPSWQEVVQVDEDPPKGAYFISCPWCTSAHIAALVVFLRWCAPGIWSPIAKALAMSSVASLISTRLEE